LHGREFALLDRRTAWGEERVYFRDDAGELKRMPASWTSLGPADAFVSISAGRSNLRVSDLLQLAALIGQLKAALKPVTGKRAGRQCVK
jgi:Family of unknown function (DUF5372)